MEVQAIPYPRSVECAWCQAGIGAFCATPSGKERNNHQVRWHAISRKMKTSRAYFRLLGDHPRFGLQDGDVLLCINYPYDAKVTVLHRASDGYDPECNMYTRDVRFLRWVDESETA